MGRGTRGRAVVLVIDMEAPLPWSPDDSAVELGDDHESAWHLWRLVLLMSVRDGAESLHFHSWRGDDALAYICAGVRYALQSPGPPLAGILTRAWLDRLGAGRSWRRSTPRVAAGRVRTVYGGWSHDWYCSCWAVPGADGVDVYRAAADGRLDRAYYFNPRDTRPAPPGKPDSGTG